MTRAHVTAEFKARCGDPRTAIWRVYLRDDVRVHIDEVRGLGQFVEIESVGDAKDCDRLQRQAEAMAHALGLRPSDLVRGSYSDLLPEARHK